MDILRWSLRWLSSVAAVIVPRPGNVSAIAETAQGLAAGAAAYGGAVGAVGVGQGIAIAIAPAGAAAVNVVAAGGATAVVETGDIS